MGKDITHDSSAGGGSAHSTPADLSSPILQSELTKLHSQLSTTDLKTLQSDPSAPSAGCSLESFTTYLADPKNSILALPDPQTKDWSHPFNEYFISSSHNTYLIGNQLYGDSTTDGYRNVLQRGCRCIEIDVWDGDDGEPEVFHGYTLTKEIKFKDVCKAIKKYSFSEKEGERFEGPGEGPVIISLESHAGAEQQKKMVKIMEKVWGEALIKDIEPEDVKALPSPEELRRKILVKAKYIAPEAPDSRTTPLQRVATTSSDSSDNEHEREHEAYAEEYKKAKPKKSKVIRSLARLGAYCSSHHFPTGHPEPFLSHNTSKIPNHVYSFSEKVFARHYETFPSQVFIHNQKYLMRVYPFGLRFSSTNADPSQFWKRGVQLVALNWQKCDEGMMLNEGMFAGEGGYVLKPSGFRPNQPPPVFQKLDLAITVIAAANLPLPEESDKPKRFEPYVKIILHTASDTPPTKEHVKRKTKAKRGVECVWDTKLEFKAIEGIIEKLSLVRFKVQDEEIGTDDLSAWACIRLDRLQQGIRVVRLFDNKGRHSKGVLLVKVEKKVY